MVSSEEDMRFLPDYVFSVRFSVFVRGAIFSGSHKAPFNCCRVPESGKWEIGRRRKSALRRCVRFSRAEPRKNLTDQTFSHGLNTEGTRIRFEYKNPCLFRVSSVA